MSPVAQPVASGPSQNLDLPDLSLVLLDLPGLVQEVMIGLLLWLLPLRQHPPPLCLWRWQYWGWHPTKTASMHWLWRRGGQRNGYKLGKSKQLGKHLVAASARQGLSGGKQQGGQGGSGGSMEGGECRGCAVSSVVDEEVCRGKHCAAH